MSIRVTSCGFTFITAAAVATTAVLLVAAATTAASAPSTLHRCMQNAGRKQRAFETRVRIRFLARPIGFAFCTVCQVVELDRYSVNELATGGQSPSRSPAKRARGGRANLVPKFQRRIRALNPPSVANGVFSKRGLCKRLRERREEAFSMPSSSPWMCPLSGYSLQVASRSCLQSGRVTAGPLSHESLPGLPPMCLAFSVAGTIFGRDIPIVTSRVMRHGLPFCGAAALTAHIGNLHVFYRASWVIDMGHQSEFGRLRVPKATLRGVIIKLWGHLSTTCVAGSLAVHQ